MNLASNRARVASAPRTNCTHRSSQILIANQNIRTALKSLWLSNFHFSNRELSGPPARSSALGWESGEVRCLDSGEICNISAAGDSRPACRERSRREEAPRAIMGRTPPAIDCGAFASYYFHSSGNMNTSNAVDSLGALAQETRLNIFRLLVRHAPGGLPAGAIARRLRLPGPTLSFHLNVLAATGLVEPHKNGRSISYSANLDAVNRLTSFLMENCCGGQGGCVPLLGTNGTDFNAGAPPPKRKAAARR